MKQRKVPLRRCLITREQFPKNELIRIVVNKDKEVTVDKTGKLNGRGAYIKLTKENVEKAKKSQLFEREFDVKEIDLIYNELMELANE